MKPPHHLASLVLAVLAAGAGVLSAAPPVVKTVPWVASNPLIPHDTWVGKEISLKGTCDRQGAGIEYIWDFGDGSPVATGTVTNQYAIEARHTYSGPVGTVFTATLTVKDTSTGESASKQYYIKIESQSLSVEVNVAIDEGLWALHKLQGRYTNGGVDYGNWNVGSSMGYSWTTYWCTTPANVLAFEVNGHLEDGSADNPYTETVARGMRQLLAHLVQQAIGPQAGGDPDSNGNGIGIRVNQGNAYYQSGMYIDALIASGAPARVATVGGANIVNRTYKDIVQDIVDFYAWGMYDDVRYGGWRYSDNQFPDNSACQWAAIGLIPAERNWGCTVPAWVKAANLNWLNYSHYVSTGTYGYQGPNSFVRGPFATTPSGMVQLAMQGVGRANPLWDRAETFLRNNFANGGNYNTNIKAYYYGLFAFVKSMLLHDSNGDGVAEPIALLQSSDSATYPPIDWYGAEAATDGADGVARTLVRDQNPDGFWYENWSVDSTAERSLNTPWAIVMLQRTLFEAGAPVAVAKATPNPAVAGQTIQLDGSGSFHQDSSKSIDSWEWDLDNDGEYDDATGPAQQVSFPAVGNYPVGLKVTDDGSPEKSAVTTITVVVSIPPLAPTADADGPYTFCPQAQPWFLDGSGSVNPDEGQAENPMLPGDTIASYEWDLDGDGQFDDATGVQPDVTAYFQAAGPGSYLIQLKVTDTTATSFPSSQLGDLSDTDSAVVIVAEAGDPACSCVDDLEARAKDGKIQLTWTHTDVPAYNVYRSTTSGGPYLFIGTTTSDYSTYLDEAVVNGTPYFYVVRPAALNGNELCQSNEASATAASRNRRR